MIKLIAMIYVIILLGSLSVEAIKQPFHKRKVRSLIKEGHYPKGTIRED